ncbi:MAG: glycosyltransferase family 4 protein [Lutibacter sp.]
MEEIFPEYGIDFEVLYMAKIEPERQWVIPEESYQYKYKIYKGLHPEIGDFHAHFNPGLLLRLLKNDFQIAVVGGMASPTHWLAPFFIARNKFQIMSVESNLFSVNRKTGFGAWLKSVLLNRADAYQVTGQPQIDYIQFFQPKAKDKKYIHLPNLIDEDVFVKKVDELKQNKEELRLEFGVAEHEQMWVIPARLIQIKGIIPFLEALVGLTGYRLYLLGDGEQKKEMKEIIKINNLAVTMVGFVPESEVIRYYAAADLFVLPSFKDSSPLSPIEASAAGLPLLVSRNIGNVNEVLNKENGWSFEAGNVSEINKLARDILSLNRSDLNKMGVASRKQYNSVFETETCIRIYAQQILDTIKND